MAGLCVVTNSTPALVGSKGPFLCDVRVIQTASVKPKLMVKHPIEDQFPYLKKKRTMRSDDC